MQVKILDFGILPFTKYFSYSRTAYVLSDVMDDQLKSMWFTPFQAEEIDTDLDLV
jgi:hypothetical protein